MTRTSEPSATPRRTSTALLTGGGDTPYAFGLATALMEHDLDLDIIAGDELDLPELRNARHARLLNLRGDQRPDVAFLTKVRRVAVYYGRLVRYAVTAKAQVFHILWNNKLEIFDRTFLMVWYRALGRKVVLTVHNVNIGRRDHRDTVLNRLTLRAQYRLADHLFVHTDKMKQELIADFGVAPVRVTVIPFGINNAVPDTGMTTAEARQRLGIDPADKTLLFFGHIAPYKGLEYLVQAFQRLLARRQDYRLVIVGRPKGDPDYWTAIQRTLATIDPERVTTRIEFVSDEEVEPYFKAADVLVLPYAEIFQSGVLFLGYRFGLPAIVADVGSLRADVVEGETGLVCAPRDPEDLARVAEVYFGSDLFRTLPERRDRIRDDMSARHSWATVANITTDVYEGLTSGGRRGAGRWLGAERQGGLRCDRE